MHIWLFWIYRFDIYIYIYLDLCCHQDDAQAPAADDTKPKDDEAWVDCYMNIKFELLFGMHTHIYTKSNNLSSPGSSINIRLQDQNIYAGIYRYPYASTVLSIYFKLACSLGLGGKACCRGRFCKEGQRMYAFLLIEIVCTLFKCLPDARLLWPQLHLLNTVWRPGPSNLHSCFFVRLKSSHYQKSVYTLSHYHKCFAVVCEAGNT